jgi:superfamily I DNA and/or RNA helicase
MMLARPHLFQLKHFSLTIVDEASQILEPGLIGLLASPLIDRFVLIGDHKQLPAVVQLSAADAAVSEACLQQIGLTDCRQSLFQRLYEWELSQGRTQFVGLLDHQGRMHPQVAAFPSQLFYEGRLLPVPCDHQKETALNYTVPSEDPLDDLLKSHRVLFLPVGPAPTLPHSPQSNEAEAVLVADLLRRIHRFYGERFDAAKTVGVIVPYRNQISAIRRQTERLGIPALDEVSIDTVERYQGSQRDVIIYSFTVSRRYQLDFLTSSTFIENGRPIDRKLNVALTRARHQTLMVGNPDVLSHAPLFGQLIDTYMQRQQ